MKRCLWTRLALSLALSGCTVTDSKDATDTGTTDTTDGSHSLGTARAMLLGVSEGDYAGYSVSGAGDVNGDGYDDLLVGAYGQDAGGSLAGAAYVILGPSLGYALPGHRRGQALG